MNRQAAKKLVETGDISIGTLLDIVDEADGNDKPSKLNPGLTKQQVKKIFVNGLAGRKRNDIIKPFRRNIRTGRFDKVSSDNLLATNILREFG